MVQRNKGLNFTTRHMGGGKFIAIDNPVTRSNELIVPFNPRNDVADLTLWLDVTKDAVQLPNDNFTWLDQSSSGWDLIQSSQSAQPIINPTGLNNKPTVTFNGSSQWLDFGAISHTASNWTMFAVLDQTLDGATNQYLFSSQIGLFNISPYYSTKLVKYFDNVGWHGTQSGTLATQQLTWRLESPSSGQIRRDGVNLDTGLSYTQVAITTQSALGARYDGGGTNWFGGSLSELLLYSRSLTDSELLNVEAYLRERWGTPEP